MDGREADGGGCGGNCQGMNKLCFDSKPAGLAVLETRVSAKNNKETVPSMWQHD